MNDPRIGTEIISTLAGLLTAGLSYASSEHPAVTAAGERFAAVIGRADQEVTVQFVFRVPFLNRELISLDTKHFEQARRIGRALETLGINELTFSLGLTAEAAAHLGVRLARGARGIHDGLVGFHPTAIRWRDIPEAKWDEEFNEVDADVFVAAQLTLAIQSTEKLCASDTPRHTGLRIVRRLERSLDIAPDVVRRTIELMPGQWSPARRTISAALVISMALRHLDINVSVRRAATHAMLLVAIDGLRAREGVALDVAAHIAFESFCRPRSKSRSMLTPHRLRTAAILDAMARRTPLRWPGVLHLIGLVFDLESQRCPKGVDFALTRADLLAYASENMGRGYPSAWVKLLVSLFDTFPAGAYVRLTDGRTGVVIRPQPNDEAQADWPQVLVNGKLVQPSQPIKLLGAHE